MPVFAEDKCTCGLKSSCAGPPAIHQPGSHEMKRHEEPCVGAAVGQECDEREEHNARGFDSGHYWDAAEGLCSTCAERGEGGHGDGGSRHRELYVAARMWEAWEGWGRVRVGERRVSA